MNKGNSNLEKYIEKCRNFENAKKFHKKNIHDYKFKEFTFF